MDRRAKYKHVERDGIVAVIINRRRVLLVKRFWLYFFTTFPGIWTFVTGGKRKNETHLDAAFRETEEETGLGMGSLVPVAQYRNVALYDPVKKDKTWENALIIFKTEKSEVLLNFENTRYRWATISELRREKDYTNIFVGKGKIIRIISAHLKR